MAIPEKPYTNAIKKVTPESVGTAVGKTIGGVIRPIGGMAVKGVQLADNTLDAAGRFAKGVGEGLLPVRQPDMARFDQIIANRAQGLPKTAPVAAPVTQIEAVPQAASGAVTPQTIAQQRLATAGQSGMAQRGADVPRFLDSVSANAKALTDRGFIPVIRGMNQTFDAPQNLGFGDLRISQDQLTPGFLSGQERVARAGGEGALAQEIAARAKLGAAGIVGNSRIATANIQAAAMEASRKVAPVDPVKDLKSRMNEAIIERSQFKQAMDATADEEERKKLQERIDQRSKFIDDGANILKESSMALGAVTPIR